MDSSENPNDIAAQFIEDHPDWDLILDDDGDVIFLTSPNYKFTRVEDASSQH